MKVLTRLKFNHTIVNILIILSFIIFSMINVSLLVVSKSISFGFDMQFHWQRILEIMKSSSLMPKFSLNSFSYGGGAVLTMYPYIFLYPFVFFFKMLKSVKLVTYVMLFLNTLVALLISYYSSLKLNHNRIISYLFSSMYVISFYMFTNEIQTYALGMIYSFIFMPLVLFGFVDWIRNNKWLMLSIGMTLVIYSSVIVSAFTPIILLLWCLWDYKYLSKSKILNLIKSILMTLFTSLAFIIPAIKILLTNRLMPMGGPWIKGANIIKSFISAIVPFVAAMPTGLQFIMTIYSLLGIVIGVVLFKKLSKINKQMFILSIVLILFSSMIFPWKLLGHTSLNTIQYPWRMYVIPQVLLTYITALGIYKGVNYISKHLNINIFMIIPVIICIIFCIQLANQSSMIEEYKNNTVPNHQVLNTSTKYTDYYPKKSVKYNNDILKHKGEYFNNKLEYIKINPLGNGIFHFNMPDKNNRNLKIPFLYYHDVNYKCFLNGKYIKSNSSKNQLMEFRHVPKGSHKLKISIPVDKFTIYARILSLITLIIYVLIISKCIVIKRHLRN